MTKLYKDAAFQNALQKASWPHLPVVDGQAHIFGAVLQRDVRVLGAELDVLPAGVGHSEGQSHGLKLLRRGLVVPDVHQAGDEILVHLGDKDTTT